VEPGNIGVALSKVCFEIFELPSNITYNNWVESANIYDPIYSTDSGMIIEVKLEHS
jgi:hypothetical protein